MRSTFDTMGRWLVRAMAVALIAGAGGPVAPPAASAAGTGDPNAFERDAVFDGPADLVWRLLTTEQGVESWLVPHAEVDLRVGGYVKTNHDPDGKIGDPMTVVNRVLALTPGKSVAVRLDQTPQGYPLANMVVGTWYEVSVDPVADGRSRLRCVGHGFGAGPAAYMIRPMFDKAADMAFDQLRAAVEREATRKPAPRSAPAKISKTPTKTPPKRTR
ncbi:MAG TPA: SRPBCC domain-containing protein [Thermoanaerobaculia bacterium]|nr:SRPBCC domain-containing protein [Thermoanaerobaculia bacterium]